MNSLLRILIIPFLLLTSIYLMADEKYSGKRILFINSYHAGYAGSDETEQGVKDVLKDTGVELKVVYMDTKRNTSESFIKSEALKVKSVIEEFDPDVVIAADDNASKYVIVPYYKDTDLPVIFCAVNWDASVYGFPTKNVTGMVEVLLLPELVKHLKNYATGEDIGFIGSNTLTSRKEHYYQQERFGINYKSAYFASNFQEWKEMFFKLQSEVDMVVMSNQVGLGGWNDEEAIKFVEDNTKIPVGTWVEWVVPYALLGVINRPIEQGSWAAQAALKVLEGVPPSKIPMTRNKKGEFHFNSRIGKRLGIETPPPFATILD